MIPTLLLILATAPDPDPLDKILPWVSSFVLGVLALVFKWQAEKAKAVKLEEPVPTVPTRKVSQPPSWDQHEALAARVGNVEREIKDLRQENSREYKALLEAGAAREVRILEKIDQVARDWHGRLDALNPPKGGGR